MLSLDKDADPKKAESAQGKINEMHCAGWGNGAILLRPTRELPLLTFLHAFSCRF